MSLVAFVVHRFKRVELRVDPVKSVTHREVDGDAFGVSDAGGDNRFSFRSVHPGRFDLGLVAGVRPEHETVLGIEGDGGRVVELSGSDFSFVATVVLRNGDYASRSR